MNQEEKLIVEINDNKIKYAVFNVDEKLNYTITNKKISLNAGIKKGKISDFDHTAKIITEDLATAKTIFKEKIREVRRPLLEEQDVLYMKALEDDDSSAQTTIKNKKKSLRDAPAASSITNADTIAKLKAAWDTSLLGDSPYA